MDIIRWDGRPIDKPCVVSHMPLDRYHAADICVGPSISSSGLRTIFTKSPAHFYADLPLNPDRDEEDEEKKKENEAFILGRAAHHIFLGEDDFASSFIMRPETAPDGRAWNGNNLTCIKWLDDQAKSGRTVLTPKQIKAIRGMGKSLSRHPVVDAGILNGGIELSIFWIDKETGIWCKARPDAIPNDSGDLADLKTSAKFGEDLDRGIFFDYRYDMQGEFVRWGIREVWKREIDTFSLVFVEKKQPHSVEIVTIDKAAMSEATVDLRLALKVFKHCYETNNFFGPGGTQQDGRYAYRSKWAEEKAMYRRSVLEREIAPKEGEQ